MAITFFNCLRMVYCHFVIPGRTVTVEYYKGVLEKLIRVHIPQKRPAFQRGRFKLYHDNPPVHMARIVLEFLRKKGVELIPYPTYSPDLAPNDFFLYPTLKRSLKGWRFSSINEIETAVLGGLQRISKDGFQEVFEQWQKCWDKCVRLRGEYIECVRDRQE